MVSRFPADIQDFANCFVAAQRKRHDADYNPSIVLTRSEVIFEIDAMESAIEKFRGVPIKDKRAFAAYVLLKKRES